ncbi:phage tail terminator protein [Litorisediminicola beolgyonensis]|uniref:Uncharacterized protein n=1 Tax=Litorisediminicola beolgyonensis TaxID=1173614 RepID=A0ABW3ZIN9_9RHOB
MFDDVKARLEASVPDLAGRIEGAAEFSALQRDNRLPQSTVAAFVLPLGLTGGQATYATGLFAQALTRSVGVLLFFSSTDRTGERALERLEPFVDEVIAAIAGWAPADEVGVFELARAGLVSVGKGRMAYQIDFRINDQLRIPA